jgi:hypothetical protein
MLDLIAEVELYQGWFELLDIWSDGEDNLI